MGGLGWPGVSPPRVLPGSFDSHRRTVPAHRLHAQRGGGSFRLGDRHRSYRGGNDCERRSGLYLVRAIGRDVVWQRISSPTIRRVDERIEKRGGWLAVGSLRLIAFVPFSVVNYCCGISSIRIVPYILATVVGILPGTVGIVVLGDALSGEAILVS